MALIFAGLALIDGRLLRVLRGRSPALRSNADGSIGRAD